ncbi:MAG: lipoyl(octanoyl) transferase LipB [Gammaproteobacteria bacterium]|jgi:lipoyl(octanoyl) transferase
MPTPNSLRIRQRGLVPYSQSWDEMLAFTAARNAETLDEFWLLQHPAVYTLGRAGKPEHLLNPDDTPVIQTDRGGQITWHGPGQVILYVLIDLQRRKLGVRALVHALESAVISLLAEHSIAAKTRADAPGVYVEEAKVAALGLRVHHGSSLHGLALNVDNDLAPYQRINPCGHVGQRVTRTQDLGITASLDELSQTLATTLAQSLGYDALEFEPTHHA